MAAFDRHHQEADGEARRNGRVSSRGGSWIRRLAMALSRPHLAFAGTAAVVVVAPAAAVVVDVVESGSSSGTQE